MKIKVPLFIIRLMIGKAETKNLVKRTSLTGRASRTWAGHLFGLFDYEFGASLGDHRKPKDQEEPKDPE